MITWRAFQIGFRRYPFHGIQPFRYDTGDGDGLHACTRRMRRQILWSLSTLREIECLEIMDICLRCFHARIGQFLRRNSRLNATYLQETLMCILWKDL